MSTRIRGTMTILKSNTQYVSNSTTSLWYEILLYTVPDQPGYHVFTAAYPPLNGPSLVAEYVRQDGEEPRMQALFICSTRRGGNAPTTPEPFEETQRTLAHHMQEAAKIQGIRIIGATLGSHTVRFWEWDREASVLRDWEDAIGKLDMLKDCKLIQDTLNKIIQLL
jgi:hypothetical protein